MNAYEMLASFRRQARKAGWRNDRVQSVLADAMSGDYENLNEALLTALAEIESDRRLSRLQA